MEIRGIGIRAPGEEQVVTDSIQRVTITTQSTNVPSAHIIVSQADIKNQRMGDIGELEMVDENSSDLAVRLMDFKYKTNFYPWIKNANNVDFIVSHLKPMLRDYDAVTLARGLKWMFQEWPLGVIANTLIKLFYERGLADEFFNLVLNEILIGRDWIEIIDLIATLATGEDCEVTAKFLHQVTKGWEPESVISLVDEVYARARWPEHFYEGVIVYWSGINVTDEPTRLETMQKYRLVFQERSRQAEKMPQKQRFIIKDGHESISDLRKLARGMLGTIIRDGALAGAVHVPSKTSTSAQSSIETSPTIQQYGKHY